MAPSEPNISPETAAEAALALQLSANQLLYTVHHRGKVIGAGVCRYDRAYSEAANLAAILNAEPCLQKTYGRVVVVVDTGRVVAVPEELAGPALAMTYLKANSVAVAPGETIICSTPVKSITAIFPQSQEVAELLSARYGTALGWLHPLQIGASKLHEKPTVELNLGEGSVYITVKAIQLLHNEAFLYREPLDLLFFLQELDKLYGLGEYEILVSGEGASEAHTFLRRYYRRTRIDKGIHKQLPKAVRDASEAFNNLIYGYDANH